MWSPLTFVTPFLEPVSHWFHQSLRVSGCKMLLTGLISMSVFVDVKIVLVHVPDG